MPPGVMPGDSSMDMIHISNMSACSDIGRMREGQNWSVREEYDFTKSAPMRMDGSPSPIMGIAMLYVSQRNEDDDDKAAAEQGRKGGGGRGRKRCEIYIHSY
jgi:hypothetical protein